MATSIAAAGLLLLAACSAASSHPPDLGACKANCSSPIVGAGGTSGSATSDGGTGTCSTTTNDGQCVQCLGAHCCNALEACPFGSDCQNLSSCENACTTSACVPACQNSFAAGVAPLDALSSCEISDCPVCSELGVGDPCMAHGTPCLAGLSCGALWCTKTCLQESDCSGLGAGGGNALGLANECIRSASNGNLCSPGCATDSDCESFPGTYCLVTTSVDGLSVAVCAGSPDAGTD